MMGMERMEGRKEGFFHVVVVYLTIFQQVASSASFLQLQHQLQHQPSTYWRLGEHPDGPGDVM